MSNGNLPPKAFGLGHTQIKPDCVLVSIVVLSFLTLILEFCWRRFYRRQDSLLAIRGILLADDY